MFLHVVVLFVLTLDIVLFVASLIVFYSYRNEKLRVGPILDKRYIKKLFKINASSLSMETK